MRKSLVLAVAAMSTVGIAAAGADRRQRRYDDQRQPVGRRHQRH